MVVFLKLNSSRLRFCNKKNRFFGVKWSLPLIEEKKWLISHK